MMRSQPAITSRQHDGNEEVLACPTTSFGDQIITTARFELSGLARLLVLFSGFEASLHNQIRRPVNYD